MLAQYGYDPLARLTSLAFLDSSSLARSYEADDDLATLTHTFNGGTLGFSYTSNGAAQLKTIATANASLLTGPPAAPASYTPNLLNQYSAVEAASLSYDANGNLAGDGRWTYRYDEENRLRQATRPGMTAEYAYDPQGRRRSKTVNGTTTYFVNDGPNELAELNSAGTRQRFYLNGLGIDERVGLFDDAGGSGWQFFHPNHQGSVVLTTLASTGGGAGAFIDYGAFGESIAPTTGNPIRYTGRYLDAESGLYYYRARYYSPSLGRFLQTDPIGVKDDLNLYAYVGNDPLNKTDPTGQEGEFLLLRMILATAGADAATPDPTDAAAPAKAAGYAGAILGSAIGGTIAVLINKASQPDGSDNIIESRSKPPGPLPEAEGRPHSIPTSDGGYTTHGPSDPTTGKPESTKQFRPSGKAHGTVDRPNVKDTGEPNVRPDGAREPGKAQVRQPRPDEIRRQR